MTRRRAAALVRLVVPAAVVGIGSAVTLVGLSVASDRLQDLLWDTLPGWLDIGAGSAAWIIAMLTATGLVVGIIVAVVPGHAGPDPATQELVSAPLAPGVLPGLAAAAVVGLAGGVSLGPENPIVAVNVALAVWIGRRTAAGVPLPQWVGFAVAGTIGAMFGTPVGAALVLTEAPADPGGPAVWDRLFAPLVAASTGALTMMAFGQPSLSTGVDPYPGTDWPDVVSAPLVALGAALLGLTLVYALPVVHAAFRRIAHPVLMLTAGGLVLGILGAIGGRITLFKGLDEMKELLERSYGEGRLTVIVAVKLAALLVAAACGFRGGRIFPAVFAGVAIGLLAQAFVDDIPLALAVAAAVLGITVVVTRSGWLSLFVAVTTVGQVEVLPVLCIALLPVWLLVTDRPELLVQPPPGPQGVPEPAVE